MQQEGVSGGSSLSVLECDRSASRFNFPYFPTIIIIIIFIIITVIYSRQSSIRACESCACEAVSIRLDEMKDETPRMTEMTRKPFLTIAIGVLTTVSALSDPAQIVIPATITPQTTDPLVSWLAQETSYALDGVLNNVGPNGAKATGASSGIIIASPSQSNPDCE